MEWKSWIWNTRDIHEKNACWLVPRLYSCPQPGPKSFWQFRCCWIRCPSASPTGLVVRDDENRSPAAPGWQQVSHPSPKQYFSHSRLTSEERTWLTWGSRLEENTSRTSHLKGKVSLEKEITRKNYLSRTRSQPLRIFYSHWGSHDRPFIAGSHDGPLNLHCASKINSGVF